MNSVFLSLALFAASRDIFVGVRCYDDVKSREKRYLVYPRPGVGNAPTKMQLILGLGLPMEGGLIIGYVLKHNYNLPYNSSIVSEPYVRYERSTDYEKIISREMPIGNNGRGAFGIASRWEIYGMVGSAIGMFGNGRSCLLRAICETARLPFNEEHGLLGELLHVFLTPSTTSEEFFDADDQEYFAAEMLGRKSFEYCQKFSSECEISPLEYFTEVDG